MRNFSEGTRVRLLDPLDKLTHSLYRLLRLFFLLERRRLGFIPPLLSFRDDTVSFSPRLRQETAGPAIISVEFRTLVLCRDFLFGSFQFGLQGAKILGQINRCPDPLRLSDCLLGGVQL